MVRLVVRFVTDRMQPSLIASFCRPALLRFWDFLDARAGSKWTIPYGVVFATVFMALLVRNVDGLIAGPLAMGELPYSGTDRHPHLVGFPTLLALVSLDGNRAWIIYPIVLAMFGPSLWLYLACKKNVPLIICTLLIVSILKSPFVSHVSLTPNSDLLSNILMVSLLLFVIHYPQRLGWIFIIFLCAMLTHQRAIVLTPGLILCMLYYSPQCPATLWEVSARNYFKIALPYLMAGLLFFIYQRLYYLQFPAGEENRPLFLTEQFRNLIRSSEARDVITGGTFDYVLSADNVRVNGAFYFSFVLLAVGAWFSRNFMMVCIALAFYLGIIAQLLVAEDIHRLTGYLFLISLLLAIESARKEWPFPRITSLFFIIGFSTTMWESIQGRINAVLSGVW